MEVGQLVAELKRRRVFRVLVGYGIVSFAVLQIVEPIMHALHLPDMTLTYVVLALALGFPLAVVLAWAFDINEGKVERTAPATSRALSGVRLPLLLMGIGVAAAAPGMIWFFVLPGHLRTSASASAPASGPPSIAVLPFADMSPGKDQEYFSDGIAEEILNALAQVEGLRVAGRTSSFYFKGRKEDLANIAAKLRVSTLLEGSVRKAGDRVRITAQLINAADGYHLWSGQYDRDLTDIFKLQGELATAVVEALKVKLLPGTTMASKVHPAKNPEAYRLALLGRSLLLRPTPENTRRAEEVLNRAVALEPSYAPSWQWLAALRGNAALMAPRPESQELLRGAQEAAERAVAADPEYADGYAIRGWLRSQFLWDWEGGKRDLQRAMSLTGSEITLHLYATLLQKVGQLKEAIAAERKVIEVDPLNVYAWTNLSAYLTNDGQLDAARAAVARAQEITPNNTLVPELLANIEILDRHPAKALALIEKIPREGDRLVAAAIAEHDLGHAREARAALEALTAKADSGESDTAYGLAAVHAWRGERDGAFEWLERAWGRHDFRMRWIKIDSFLRSLRGDPRYNALLEKMNLPRD